MLSFLISIIPLILSILTIFLILLMIYFLLKALIYSREKGNKYTILASICTAVLALVSFFDDKVPSPTIYPSDNETEKHYDNAEKIENNETSSDIETMTTEDENRNTTDKQVPEISQSDGVEPLFVISKPLQDAITNAFVLRNRLKRLPARLKSARNFANFPSFASLRNRNSLMLRKPLIAELIGKTAIKSIMFSDMNFFLLVDRIKRKA